MHPTTGTSTLFVFWVVGLGGSRLETSKAGDIGIEKPTPKSVLSLGLPLFF